MDLHTRHTNLYGKKVGVNDTQYDVDDHGVVHGLSDEDGQTLLHIDGWLKVEDAEQRGQVSKTRDDSNTGEEEKPIPHGGYIPPVAASAVGMGIQQWPAPSVNMDVRYLREMADYFDLSYTERTSKAMLVARIEKALYPKTNP